MAAMEELEIHSKVGSEECDEESYIANRVFIPPVLLRPLGPRQIRSYYLLEHSTA